MPSVRLHFFIGNVIKSFLQFILIFGILALAFISLTSISHAQDTEQTPTKPDTYANTESDVPHNLHSYYQVAFIEFSSALVCQLAGVNPINTKEPCLGVNPISGKIGFSPVDPKHPQADGLGSVVSNMIAMLYVPPISSGQQLHYFASNFGIVTAHAQTPPNTGQGFTGLNAVQDLFIKTRNMVYVLMVILFVVIGIAIMLRIKIDPRTVMSIQNQIPKIVIGLVLITFSYAIAGFLIDVMWTVTYFSINTMTHGTELCKASEGTQTKPLGSVATRQIVNNPISYLTDLLGDETGCFGTFDGISGLALDVGRTFGDVLSRITLAIFGMDTQLAGCNPGLRGLRFWAVLDVQDCLKVGFFGILKYLISLIAGIVIFFSLIIAMFKIWFTLLKAYISFTLAVVLAPFWIILGLLPGGGLGFGQWIRHMVSHLAVFPTVALMLVLATIFAANGQSNDPSSSVFLPPLIGNPNISDGIGTIMAFAVILLVPDMLNLVRDALKTPQGKYTGNIMKRAKVSPMSAVGQAGNLGYQFSSLHYIPIIGKRLPGGADAGPGFRHKAASEALGGGHPPNSGG